MKKPSTILNSRFKNCLQYEIKKNKLLCTLLLNKLEQESYNYEIVPGGGFYQDEFYTTKNTSIEYNMCEKEMIESIFNVMTSEVKDKEKDVILISYLGLENFNVAIPLLQPNGILTRVLFSYKIVGDE